MTREEVQSVVERFIAEIWNQGNMEAVDEVISADLIYHEPMQTIKGIEPYRQYVESFRATFPNAEFTTEDLLIDGDRAAFRWSLQAAHEGNHPDVPLPATGMEFDTSGQTTVRFEDGKVAEIWMQTDYSRFLAMAVAFGAAVLGAIVGLLVLIGLVSKQLRGNSGR